MSEAGDRPARYAPERRFPPYAYLPGSETPHPRKHPGGHSYAAPEPAPPPLDPDRWEASGDYRFAIDLFNHGYYWEAHEVLEGLWIAAGKRGAVSELLKGLIKLCAAGVKARQGMPGGVEKHLVRAQDHFAGLSSAMGGFDPRELQATARRWRARGRVGRLRPGPAEVAPTGG